MLSRLSLVVLFLALLSTICGVSVAELDYRRGEFVPVYADAVYSSSNKLEKYDYYHFPFCRPVDLKFEERTLWDILRGSAKKTSTYRLFFAINSTDFSFCRLNLEKRDWDRFVDGIKKKYVFTFFLDDIEVSHPIGYFTPEKDVVLNTWIDFKIFITTNRIVKVEIRSEGHEQTVMQAEPQQLNFTYSVFWVPVDSKNGIIPENEESFSAGKVSREWFSILNSLFGVALLSVFVLFILAKTIKRDFQRYGVLEEEMDEEDGGWKRLHADVFRFPKNQLLFCSITGCGSQILLLTFVVFVFILTSALTKRMKTIADFVVFVYLLSVPFCGFMSGSLYRKFEGKYFSRNVLLTYCLLTIPFLFVCFTINTAASKNHMAYAISWSLFYYYSIFLMGSTLPLLLLGTIIGKRFSGPFDAPTRTKVVPREIPSSPWYRGTLTHLLLGGLLPFTAIHVELHYVYLGFWRDHSPMSIVLYFMMFIVLTLVTAGTSIVLTYDNLSAENHKWWWSSLLCGGSIAVFIFSYSVFFLFVQTEMSSVHLIVMYFGYTLFCSYCAFLAMSTVGFYSSLLFVRQIYGYIKND